jgi:hypothetical protein
MGLPLGLMTNCARNVRVRAMRLLIYTCANCQAFRNLSKSNCSAYPFCSGNQARSLAQTLTSARGLDR